MKKWHYIGAKEYIESEKDVGTERLDRENVQLFSIKATGLAYVL